MKKALEGIRVLDLSRVLAGPFCTQVLGDLGAEIIKIEKPGTGDDTRQWGPPFLKTADGEDTSESAYYLSCNRNKKSVAIDIKSEDGRALIHGLLEKSDILIQNFKVGGLEKYGLGYEQVHKRHPHIIYAAITGFGQSGPLASEPGYDFLAQAMSGLMACTGEPDGPPMKVGVALSDVMTGMMTGIGILSALHARDTTGTGQLVDISLLDTSIAALTNIAQYYLTSGMLAPRLGNAHSTIVPYQAFKAKDGYIIIAIGNNDQFKRFCDFIGKPEWTEDKRFARNRDRVQNRETLVPMIEEIMSGKTMSEWIEGFHEADVPCGPVNTMDKVFEMEQAKTRNMRMQMDHPLSTEPVDLVGSPLKLSETPVSYEQPPPVCGQHTKEVLQNCLDLSPQDLQRLEENSIIETRTL